jgi:hypothetical protein
MPTDMSRCRFIKTGPNLNLSQVPTIRDALVTGLTLDTFHRHADRPRHLTSENHVACEPPAAYRRA